MAHALIKDRPRWQRPGVPSLALEPGGVDLWRIRLDDRAPRQQAGEALDRILRRYLDLGPGRSPVIRRHPGGKPYLAEPAGALEFNLSHTRGLAVVAVSTSPVGVDLERQRTVQDPLRIAARVWAPDEIAWLEAQPPTLRTAAFLVGWTRFEARQKVSGRGVFAPPTDPRPLSERVFLPADGYVACVAVTATRSPTFRHLDHGSA